ncbi:MAG: nickel-dependent lactate racemase [Proteobacteria bacterium]|nr:nickel-dependent lactate racemase [Pseudomonadota bacterium]
MHIDLNFGRGSIPLKLEKAWKAEIIRKPLMPFESDPKLAIQKALNNPINSLPLLEKARTKDNACILICDITRPVPNHLLLPEIVSVLLKAGISQSNIEILIATGLHRPNEGEELEQLIGDPWILENIKIFNHFAKNDEDHALIGTTTKGTKVKLDKRFVNADLKIVTGLVEPHFMAGYSGGRKVIAPGVAHEETITTFHNHKFMSDPNSDSCILNGNPLHQEQLEIVSMLGEVLCVNTVLDEHRNLSLINFGEIVASHLAAVAFAKDYLSVPMRRKFNTIVTSAAGYPLDSTYYQTVKGMVVPYQILEPGGDLIIASECAEGMGSKEFRKAQQTLVSKGAAAFCAEIAQKAYAAVDEWQTQMQTKIMKVGHVHLYSPGLSSTDHKLTGVNIIDNLDEFVRSRVLNNLELYSEPSLAVIPEGPYVVPTLI